MRIFHALACGLVASIVTPALQAADNASANGCTFAPPGAVLERHAYPNYTFTRKSENRAVEAADVRQGLRVEIAHSQCVDLVVNEITFIVPRGQQAQGNENENDWLEFARIEIGRLKLARSASDFGELQQFLVDARHIAQRDGARSKCKDGSVAEAGQCSWESMGGYVFRLKKNKSGLRISATQYSSA